jgi:hypothetical protein
MTHIRYSLPFLSRVKVEIYNTLGQRVITLVDARQQPGNYVIDFDGTHLTSGLYFYRLEAENYLQVRKMLLIR